MKKYFIFTTILLIGITIFFIFKKLQSDQNLPESGLENKEAVFVPPQRNIDEKIQFSILREKIDPAFNQVHDELSEAYYEKKPFRNYGVLTKEKFDKLHALIFYLRDVKFHSENLKLPENQRIPEEEYDYIFDNEGKEIGRKSKTAEKQIQQLNEEGLNLNIP